MLFKLILNSNQKLLYIEQNGFPLKNASLFVSEQRMINFVPVSSSSASFDKAPSFMTRSKETLIEESGFFVGMN